MVDKQKLIMLLNQEAQRLQHDVRLRIPVPQYLRGPDGSPSPLLIIADVLQRIANRL